MENIVHNSAKMREQFTEFVSMATKGKVTYKEATVAKAIDELSKLNILIRHSKGTYVVNPILFMRGGKEKDRVKLIKMTLEFNATKTKLEIVRTLEKELKKP